MEGHEPPLQASSGSRREGDKHRPIASRQDLFQIFFDAIKPREQFRIGAEAEKFGVHRVTGAPLPYEGEWSVARVLEALIERHGWTPESEYPGGPKISLVRAGASITLEPGGQLELSGAPLDNIHLICTEMSGHLAELRDISAELDIAWLGVGFHPFAKQADLGWVPKQRYGIMKRYLPMRGSHGLDMMRRTATVQANFDYSSEELAMRMVRVALRLSPVTTAMFANSPFYEGEPFGGKSFRARVWLSVDPGRQGLVRQVLEGSGGFEEYVEWALDAPMFLVKRGAVVLENTGQSFRSFLEHGFNGERATLVDWETHLNTLFPEVRLKRTIEVRGGDSLPSDLACALPALWTGLLYDERAFAQAEDLVSSWSFDELEALRPEIVTRGLDASFRGAPLHAVAQRVLELGMSGLERRARLSRQGKDERSHLVKFAELINAKKCPADALLDGLPTEPAARRLAILERTLM